MSGFVILKILQNKGLGSKMKVMKVLLSLVLVLSIFASAGSIKTEAAARTLYVPIYNQQEDNWCWVATAQSIVYYHTGDRQTTQCTFFKWGKATTTCYDATGSLELETTRILSKAYFAATGYTVGDIVSYSVVKSQVEKQQPMLTRIVWSSGATVGHQAVIYGYDDNGTGSDYITWSDVGTSGTTPRKTTYKYFVSNATFSWDDTRVGMYD